MTQRLKSLGLNHTILYPLMWWDAQRMCCFKGTKSLKKTESFCLWVIEITDQLFCFPSSRLSVSSQKPNTLPCFQSQDIYFACKHKEEQSELDLFSKSHKLNRAVLCCVNTGEKNNFWIQHLLQFVLHHVFFFSIPHIKSLQLSYIPYL